MSINEQLNEDFDISFDDSELNESLEVADDNSVVDTEISADSIGEEVLAEEIVEDDTEDIVSDTESRIFTYSGGTSSDEDDDMIPDEEHVPNLKNYILYILTDKPFNGMLTYFRHFGAHVTKIYSNIEDAKNDLVMQFLPSKIVIIDTGTGKFTSMSARHNLLELASMGDDENRIGIFYSDSVIREEARNSVIVADRDITWHKYKNTANVLAILLQNLKKENYVYTKAFKDNYVRPGDDHMRFIGGSTKGVDEMDRVPLVMSIEEFMQNFHADTNSLEKYQVKV